MEKGRYFLSLSYKGTAYSGWQVQPGQKTVQGCIEDALSLILQEEIKLTGAGRTDTGVHASYYIAHFDSSENSLAEDDLVFKLNGCLPKDIAIISTRKVKDDAHARFDAISRTYRYIISSRKDPFSINQYTYLRSKLDLDAMNRAADYMMEYSDFTSFSKLHTDVKTNNCKIHHARWFTDKEKVIFEIRADRFLRNMVRAIAGTMIDIGTGRTSPENIRAIIEARERSEAGKSVSPDGLYLTDVEYPDKLWSQG